MMKISGPVLAVGVCLLAWLLLSQDTVDKVKPGEDATLQCRGPEDADVTLLKWTNSDLGSERYVFFYRENRLYPRYQHPSYRGRVELKDPDMRDGDVSVVLKNVTTSDAGRYECHIGDTGSEPKFIRSVTLTVTDSGTEEGGVKEGGVKERGVKEKEDKERGNKHVYIGLGVGLTVVVVVVVVVVVGFKVYNAAAAAGSL